mmetsp:Transcript_14562/g.31727  ORF Transcript_14562/g.31727 Transcript_14562/m.31727 type:complete len:90 (-) Transcript_14562:1389-1658(-)
MSGCTVLQCPAQTYKGAPSLPTIHPPPHTSLALHTALFYVTSLEQHRVNTRAHARATPTAGPADLQGLLQLPGQRLNWSVSRPICIAVV